MNANLRECKVQNGENIYSIIGKFKRVGDNISIEYYVTNDRKSAPVLQCHTTYAKAKCDYLNNELIDLWFITDIEKHIVEIVTSYELNLIVIMN